MHSCVLQMMAMYEIHTGAHMAEVLQQATEEWKLNGKDPAVVIDNAANKAKTLELTGYKHIRCFTHT